ncbi:hypothetical protein [Streptomyces sp. NPDC046925]|uniref:hypothetical protein n=1 Tax=Streptomyces sp. NPDC046925 TaxID=3155375 RepID=UPI0033D17654
MHIWFDKEGRAIDADTASRLLGDFEYKRVGRTHVTSLSDPAVDLLVSTVWLGLNHQFGDGPPLLFETMVFGSERTEQYTDRYSTLAEAEAGHAETVTLVAATVRDDVIAEVDGDPQPVEAAGDVVERIDEILNDRTVSGDAMRSRPLR